MAAPTVKDCHAMTSFYIKMYKARYSTEPVLNRHRARWGFSDILMGLSTDKVKWLLQYYLSIESDKKHSLDWFFYNYERLIASARQAEKDAAHRALLRQESEKRAMEWRNRLGDQGIIGH